MSRISEQRAAAHHEAGLILSGLAGISGLLEEVTTVWRRAGTCGPASPDSPGGLQARTRNLADAVRGLPDAGSGEIPALAFSAVTQLDALGRDVAAAAATARSHDLGDRRLWAGVQERLPLISGHLWSLLGHLAASGGRPGPQELAAGDGTPALSGAAVSRPSPAPDGEAQLALAMSNAIDALPEAELRRLLKLIAGLDPEALQRAAACYTEMFCAVAEVEASVAALLPVAVPGP